MSHNTQNPLLEPPGSELMTSKKALSRHPETMLNSFKTRSLTTPFPHITKLKILSYSNRDHGRQYFKGKKAKNFKSRFAKSEGIRFFVLFFTVSIVI